MCKVSNDCLSCRVKVALVILLLAVSLWLLLLLLVHMSHSVNANGDRWSHGESDSERLPSGSRQAAAQWKMVVNELTVVLFLNCFVLRCTAGSVNSFLFVQRWEMFHFYVIMFYDMYCYWYPFRKLWLFLLIKKIMYFSQFCVYNLVYIFVKFCSQICRRIA